MTVQLLDQLRQGDSVRSLANFPALPPRERLLRSVGRKPLGRGPLDRRAAFSTACWRGYVAHWSVSDGMLFLDALFGTLHLPAPGPLAATWYSGWLRVQHGPAITPGCFGFDRVHEREQRLHVIEGRIVEEVWVDNGRGPWGLGVQLGAGAIKPEEVDPDA